MVTTFVRSPGNRTKELWLFIEEVSRTDIALAEMGHSAHKDLLCKCKGRVTIYVHPCFYRSLKLRYPFDVGGISRDGGDSTVYRFPASGRRHPHPEGFPACSRQ